MISKPITSYTPSIIRGALLSPPPPAPTLVCNSGLYYYMDKRLPDIEIIKIHVYFSKLLFLYEYE